MKPPIFHKQTIRSLRRDLLARRFAVPKLQRNFVWDAHRAAKLLDSIYKNMPIGSLFLWEMDRKSAHLIRQSSEVLPSFSTANRKVWFVIDGQQRLSVLFQAFEGEKRENDAGRMIDFRRLCFVVEPDITDEEPQRVVYRKADCEDYVPLHDVLAPDWRRRMPSHSAWYLKRVQECRERILKYPVPIVRVTRATLEEIGEVFIRVNSQGMRITSADRAIALMGELDVRAMAVELRHRVRDSGFKLHGIEPILMGFNLIAERPSLDGDPPKLEAMARRWSKRIAQGDEEKEHFRDLWHAYQKSFLAAVDYLRDRFPIYDESYLPSGIMLSTLAVFFYHHSGPPDARQAVEIRKWFWATGVAQRYSGRGYHRNIVADAKLFESLARGTRRRFVFRDYLDPVLDIQSAEYASRAARTRTFFCLLAIQQPRYLENGEPIPLGTEVVSHANRSHRHHIFPKAQLSNQQMSARTYNGLCNICFLVSRDNLKIGMKLPRSYLSSYRADGKSRFGKVMRSHLIPAGPEGGVWERGVVKAFKRFRDERRKLICSAFEKAAGIRLFRRS